MAGTREDALLMVELAKWGAMMDFGKAARAIYADDFDGEAADVLDEDVSTMLFFFETLGTLVRNGLFDRDLAYDWFWVKGAWERVGPAAERARSKVGVPEMYANFQRLAEGQA